MSAVLDFLRGTGRDDRGRCLADIRALDDEQLDQRDDFMQWLFPLDATSTGATSTGAAGPAVLSPEDVAAIRRDPALRASLRRSLDRMLAFHGLAWDGDRASIRLAPFFALRAAAWIGCGNHNFLRIARILRSLVLAGEREAAQALLQVLRELHSGPHGRVIGAETLGAWKRAASGEPP